MAQIISSKVSLRIKTSGSNKVYKGFAPGATEENLRAFGSAITSLQKSAAVKEQTKITDQVYEL